MYIHGHICISWRWPSSLVGPPFVCKAQLALVPGWALVCLQSPVDHRPSLGPRLFAEPSGPSSLAGPRVFARPRGPSPLVGPSFACRPSGPSLDPLAYCIHVHALLINMYMQIICYIYSCIAIYRDGKSHIYERRYIYIYVYIHTCLYSYTTCTNIYDYLALVPG